jgi:hypothetical protein
VIWIAIGIGIGIAAAVGVVIYLVAKLTDIKTPWS